MSSTPVNSDPEALLKRYEQLISAAGDVIFTTDPHGYCIYVSDSVEQLFGYQAAEVIGKHFSVFVDEGWRERTANFYLEQFQNRIPESRFEFVAVSKGGETRWVEQIVMLQDEDGEVKGFNGFVRDISSFKATETQLRNSELTLRAIVDNTTDYILIRDFKGHYLMVNPAVERANHMTAEQMIGKTDIDIYGEEGSRMVRQTDQEVLATKNTVSYEATYQIPGGERSFSTIKFPFYADGGELRGVIAITRDVTDHLRTEKALIASEERFRTFAESVNALILVIENEQFIYNNTAAENLTGYPRRELLTMNVLELIHPEHRNRAESMFQAQQHHSYLPARDEFKIVCANGEERWVDMATSPMIFDGKPVLVVTALDITKRKLVEADSADYINRLEIIQRVDVELTQSLSFEYVLKIALDAAVRISHAEAGAIHLIEDERMWVAQVIGDYPRSLIGSRIPMDVGIVGRVVRQIKAEMISDVTHDPDYVPNVLETKAQITIPLISGDRMIGVLNVQTPEPGRFTPQMFDFLKLLAARIANSLDNARLYDTTQKQLEELQGLYHQVSSLEQLKTQMIRVAAHDLRNPLGVISGCLQMLSPEMDPTISERARDYNRIMKQAVERMDKITRDILTLERVESGRGFMDELIDLGELVGGVCSEFQDQAKERNQEYQLKITSKVVRVHGERAMLRETIGNLISNAIKYTPESGKVCVVLKAEGDHAVFEVEDTGFGIPTEHQANLFQPFYRVKTQETRTIKGTGLGLHLVKSIIEQHKGQMHFQSTYGKGSMFGFELPLARKSGKQRSPAPAG